MPPCSPPSPVACSIRVLTVRLSVVRFLFCSEPPGHVWVKILDHRAVSWDEGGFLWADKSDIGRGRRRCPFTMSSSYQGLRFSLAETFVQKISFALNFPARLCPFLLEIFFSREMSEIGKCASPGVCHRVTPIAGGVLIIIHLFGLSWMLVLQSSSCRFACFIPDVRNSALNTYCAEAHRNVLWLLPNVNPTFFSIFRASSCRYRTVPYGFILANVNFFAIKIRK